MTAAVVICVGASWRVQVSRAILNHSCVCGVEYVGSGFQWFLRDWVVFCYL